MMKICLMKKVLTVAPYITYIFLHSKQAHRDAALIAPKAIEECAVVRKFAEDILKHRIFSLAFHS